MHDLGLKLSTALMEFFGPIIYPSLTMYDPCLWGPPLADTVNLRNCLMLLIQVPEFLQDYDMVRCN